MQIIPVIDLKDGIVVHAVRGERHQYQPVHLHSGLTKSSQPETVVADFLRLFPFDNFYIADLNAICGNGHHREIISTLLIQYPNINFWIDNGSQIAEMTNQHKHNYQLVIGTESQLFPPGHHYMPESNSFILSLDYKDQLPLGNPAWFNQAEYWPEQIIVMTLNQVGSNAGPDVEKLKGYCRAYPEKNFIAAGGIRNCLDLICLAEIGIKSALMATALHHNYISAQQIHNLHAKKYPGEPGYFNNLSTR